MTSGQVYYCLGLVHHSDHLLQVNEKGNKHLYVNAIHLGKNEPVYIYSNDDNVDRFSVRIGTESTGYHYFEFKTDGHIYFDGGRIC